MTGDAFEGATWASVSVELEQVSKARRVNITMPTSMLDAIDRAAQSEGETRSGCLMKAAAHYLDTKKPRVAKWR